MWSAKINQATTRPSKIGFSDCKRPLSPGASESRCGKGGNLPFYTAAIQVRRVLLWRNGYANLALTSLGREADSFIEQGALFADAF